MKRSADQLLIGDALRVHFFHIACGKYEWNETKLSDRQKMLNNK